MGYEKFNEVIKRRMPYMHPEARYLLVEDLLDGMSTEIVEEVQHRFTEQQYHEALLNDWDSMSAMTAITSFTRDDDLSRRIITHLVRHRGWTGPCDVPYHMRYLEPEVTGQTSDGHHTFDELYEYRMLYNAAAAHGWIAAGIPVVKSWRHSDGEECFGGGWFVVVASLPTGQVSNHYRAEHWDLFQVPDEVTAPEWDGHTPAVAAERIRALLEDESWEVQ